MSITYVQLKKPFVCTNGEPLIHRLSGPPSPQCEGKKYDLAARKKFIAEHGSEYIKDIDV